MPALDFSDPVSVRFPRGEWVPVTSPGDRVPSHGTERLAQQYAYDFLRADVRNRFHPAGTLRTLALGVPTQECYAWGEPIHMPFDGEIVSIADGFPEPRRVFPIREAARALRNAATFDVGSDIGPIVGNHVVARSDGVFAAFAHLALGSISVRPGQHVKTGGLISRVGHSGNSTSPHLHFQLMDGPDPRTARGLPCAFQRLEAQGPNGWVVEEDVVPRGRRRVRYRES